MNGQGTIARVCERGHLVTVAAQGGHQSGFCSECGAACIEACPRCDVPLSGLPVDAVDAYGNPEVQDWERPSFCEECGAAFPWANRQERIYELQNRLSREDLDEGTMLAVREQLDALADPSLDEEEQAKKWNAIKRLAPDFYQGVGDVVQGLATSWVQSKLGLK